MKDESEAPPVFCFNSSFILLTSDFLGRRHEPGAVAAGGPPVARLAALPGPGNEDRTRDAPAAGGPGRVRPLAGCGGARAGRAEDRPGADAPLRAGRAAVLLLAGR